MTLRKHTIPNRINTTIIIPVFNQSRQIKKCLESVLFPFHSRVEREILLVNDGSTDNSEEICLNYASQYSQIKYLKQENKGVSAARNLGLKHAAGKYIFFLDADDELEPGTIEKVTEFFELVQNEVDLVTYPIDTIYQGRTLKPHFRYQYLKESGIYDLTTMPYIGQTTMNIVVKNKFQNNILFDERQNFSEDQKYCCDVLKDKLKIGYCAEGRYIYYRSDNSSSGKLSGACYIFEQCTKFFEDLFADYDDDVPMAFQGLFVNDFYWKLCNNILLPYHYEKEEYAHAVDRLVKLLKRCDNSVILNHPQIDFFEKYYILRMKGNSGFQCEVNEDGFGLSAEGVCYIKEQSLEAVLTRILVRENKVFIQGFLKSVFFQFYEKMPVLCAVENGGKLTKKIGLHPSAHNYYLSHEPTQRFWTFSYECDVSEVKQVRFEVEVGGRWFPIHYYFMPYMPFSHKLKRYTYDCGNVKVRIDSDNSFYFSQTGSLSQEDNRKGKITTLKKRTSNSSYGSVWLYYDCSGVPFDNGMKQFLHDDNKQDGIQRYYIVSDSRQRAFLPNEKCGIEFGSKKHKSLFLQAEKIITAYIEESNFIPFAKEEYEEASGDFRFEVIYLQHGVLHIDMPWKYSPEKILADRVVVSTKQEAELFLKNGFQEENLIKSRMPRLGKSLEQERATRQRKILFAPSWRGYLAGTYEEHKWKMLDEKFQASAYFKKLYSLLTSKRLAELLERNDYILEFKLHPIFAGYQKYFDVESDRIHMISKVEQVSEYELFITDFSSFQYDFLYQEIPVLLFIPDEMEFKSGMNGYRRLGNDKAYWSSVSVEQEQVIDRLKKYMKEGSIESMEVDFFEGDNPCEVIYDSVT